MICSTPVFREIKKKYPSVILSVIASPVTAELLKYNPYVDEVVELDTKNIKGVTGKLELIKLLYKGKYDVSLSLNPNIPFAIAPLWAFIPMRIAIMPNFCGATLKIASGLNTHNVRHETGKLVVETYMEMLEFLNIQTKDISKEVYKSPEADKNVGQILGEISPSPLSPPVKEGETNAESPSSEWKTQSPFIGKSSSHVSSALVREPQNMIPSPLAGEGKGEGELVGELNKPIIGIAISSGNKLKELGTEKITELINTLLNNIDTHVVLIGSKGDSETADKIFESINKKDRAVNATGKLRLTELPALIEKLSLFIGVDTGITYMTDALNIPTIHIAGPIDTSEQRPIGERVTIIQHKLPCVPCTYVFKAAYSCKRGDRICITSVDVLEIIEAAKKLLQGHKIQDSRYK
jgi:ADP-heptose:LPS heptosyltransferase